MKSETLSLARPSRITAAVSRGSAGIFSTASIAWLIASSAAFRRLCFAAEFPCRAPNKSGGPGGNRTRVRQVFPDRSYAHFRLIGFGDPHLPGGKIRGPYPGSYLGRWFRVNISGGHALIYSSRSDPKGRESGGRRSGLLGQGEFHAGGGSREALDFGADGGGISVVVSFFPRMI